MGDGAVTAIQTWSDLIERLGKAGKKLVVLEFWATWSEPSKYMKQAYKDLANDFKEVEFYTLDVDKFKDLAENAGVEALPTFMLIKEYDVEDTVVGVKKEQLRKSITAKLK
ncbi:thioredoxin H-type-like [Phragmites australis]|uniref:thioredoxin H-type-like n=1 Tax=Phragmites australis TaxID=29695 RepID=UPI002D7966BC|nr:thioredoxin H-type-like [Phragmites australis]